MSLRPFPRVRTIPPGVRFLPVLARALLDGSLVPGFRHDGDPLALADVTIYVPTRRAARELRGVFVDLAGGVSSILPVIRPLGEFDEDGAVFDPPGAAMADLAPPIGGVDRLLLLAPLVKAWKQRLSGHVAQRFAEEVVVPASTGDAIWLARDLAGLIDEVETEGVGWEALKDLVSGDLAGWWQVTVDFLSIVTRTWPEVLAERRQSDPSAHRNAAIRAEAARLAAYPPAGPVIAAGSTGSIPATAALLSVIARLPQGAVILPGLDTALDARSWEILTAKTPDPPVLGHPQYGLARLVGRLGVTRADIEPLAQAPAILATRTRVLGHALRPADTTDEWRALRAGFAEPDLAAAFADVSLVEAANEREEAVAIAIALRQAIDRPGRTAALVTGDRDLGRRVSAELLRFGIQADDSGGTPLSAAPPAGLLRLMLRAVLRPGDPAVLLGLLKHPLLMLGLPRATVRRAAELIELVALRGGTGRPAIDDLSALFERRLAALRVDRHQPLWLSGAPDAELDDAKRTANALAATLEPLSSAWTAGGDIAFGDALRATVAALEALAQHPEEGAHPLYAGDAGKALAQVLRGLIATTSAFEVSAAEWPDIVEALLAPEVVKPSQGSDARVSIWGALEARLLSPDVLVIGGLNEGVWPRKAVSDPFMSRVMKAGLSLEPPERRIGQAAHDLEMAFGVPELVLTRSARAGDAPAVPSRWLQRLTAFLGPDQAGAMRARGAALVTLGRTIDTGFDAPLASRPAPTPPVEKRPTRFSVTEIETLRRDPYAIYARHVLRLRALDPLVRDPGAAERGSLLHDILRRFTVSGVDPNAADALDRLVEAGREGFAAMDLPADVEAVWWPRFLRLAGGIIDWERTRQGTALRRHAEARAEKTPVGNTGVTLSGIADRIDVLPGGMADIIDFKSGSGPSKRQAHTLLSPQLALEAALLQRGAFDLGTLQPADLAYVRLKPGGDVVHESILEIKGSLRTADDLGHEAWTRLERLLDHYAQPATGYKSRALPFRERDTDGEYDHLARVLEWSAGGEDGESGGDE
jgi:ATP-dependent helicase/nuclease subunit B